jgi:hypothetical protein
MKTQKHSLIIAAGLLLAAAGAQAQVEVNISGAVAFRDTAYRSIRSLYGANLTSENPDTPGNPSSSIKVTWTGTIPSLFGGQTVTIRANYNGAVAGIQDLVQDRNVSYFSSSTPGVTNLVSLHSDLAFGSVFQASTAFTSPALVDSKFGVTPVFFVKSTSAPAGLTSITRQQFRVLAANGAVPGWFLTGDTNDTALIYYISRDPTAGQRVIVQKESAYTGSIISYLWNTNTSSFQVDATGRNSTQIRDTLNISGPAVSFLTGVDAINVNGGANILGYNGYKAFVGSYSSISNYHAQVITGQYTQWGYEHLLNRTTAPAETVTFRNALLAAIDSDLQTSAFSLPISRVKVERSAEGGPVSPIE